MHYEPIQYVWLLWILVTNIASIYLLFFSSHLVKYQVGRFVFLANLITTALCLLIIPMLYFIPVQHVVNRYCGLHYQFLNPVLGFLQAPSVLKQVDMYYFIHLLFVLAVMAIIFKVNLKNLRKRELLDENMMGRMKINGLIKGFLIYSISYSSILFTGGFLDKIACKTVQFACLVQGASSPYKIRVLILLLALLLIYTVVQIIKTFRAGKALNETLLNE